jgi:hypothetical protein
MPAQTTAASRERLVTNFPWLSQVVAAFQGVVLVTIAVAGFSATGFSNFAGQVGHQILGVSVNPLANLLNLALGIYALVASTRQSTALKSARVLFLGNLLLFLYGVYAASNPQDSILATNGYANGLHLLLALLAHW